MTHPTSRITEAQKESPNKARVEADLRELQDKNRLAIHVWENKKGSIIRDNLEELSDPSTVYSMSLIPSAKAQKSICPYSFHRGCKECTPAYLFDLSQNDIGSPKVLRVFPKTFESGYVGDSAPRCVKIVSHKDPHLELVSGYKPLDDLYAPFEHLKADSRVALDALKDKAHETNSNSFSEQQLDALGEFYMLDHTCPDDGALQSLLDEYRSHDFDRENKPYVRKGEFHTNEMLVMARREHITAIAIPMFTPTKSTRPCSISLAQAKLSGAIYGLKQLEKGVDVPVVLYHVDGKHQGKCTYIAQGEKELIKTIVEEMPVVQKEAIRILSEDGNEYFRVNNALYGHLQFVVRSNLGIELLEPLDKQENFSKLKQRLNRHDFSREAPSK